eukprot:7741505-Pyramimonas_sp.AAC.1
MPTRSVRDAGPGSRPGVGPVGLGEGGLLGRGQPLGNIVLRGVQGAQRRGKLRLRQTWRQIREHVGQRLGHGLAR